jgi:hypothetical protein
VEEEKNRQDNEFRIIKKGTKVVGTMHDLKPYEQYLIDGEERLKKYKELYNAEIDKAHKEIENLTR